MTDVERRAPVPLYVTDDQIAVELFGDAPQAKTDWRVLRERLQRHGLPPVDPLTNRRYWPAVRAFLDRRHGLRHDQGAYSVDGEESFDEDQGRTRTRSAAAR